METERFDAKAVRAKLIDQLRAVDPTMALWGDLMVCDRLRGYAGNVAEMLAYDYARAIERGRTQTATILRDLYLTDVQPSCGVVNATRFDAVFA